MKKHVERPYANPGKRWGQSRSIGDSSGADGLSCHGPHVRKGIELRACLLQYGQMGERVFFRDQSSENLVPINMTTFVHFSPIRIDGRDADES